MSVIAISRGSLAASKKLAEGFAARSGNRIVSREQVIDAAEKYGIKNTGLAEGEIIERRPPGFWDRYSDRRRQYLTCFKAALLDYAIQDSIVYHGHLAHVLLTEVPFVLRVRLDASLGKRIRMLMDERGLTKEQAADKIRDIDQRRTQWSQFLYNVDPRDYFQYDLVLNLEKMNLETAIELVVTAAARPEFQASEESLRNLKNLHLGTVIKAHLMNSPRTHGMELDIEADASTGKVIVSGDLPLVGSHTWESDIRSVLTDMENIKDPEIRIKTG